MYSMINRLGPRCPNRNLSRCLSSDIKPSFQKHKTQSTTKNFSTFRPRSESEVVEGEVIGSDDQKDAPKASWKKQFLKPKSSLLQLLFALSLAGVSTHLYREKTQREHERAQQRRLNELEEEKRKIQTAKDISDNIEHLKQQTLVNLANVNQKIRLSKSNSQQLMETLEKTFDDYQQKLGNSDVPLQEEVTTHEKEDEAETKL